MEGNREWRETCRSSSVDKSLDPSVPAWAIDAVKILAELRDRHGASLKTPTVVSIRSAERELSQELEDYFGMGRAPVSGDSESATEANMVTVTTKT